MVEAGVLGPEDKVELIEGEILLVSPEGPRHSAVADIVRRELERSFGDGYTVRPAHPLAADDRSEPEPDLLVVPGRPEDYLDRHPEPSHAVLLVEVSKTSLGFDLGRKRRLYARAGVPEYWVVDLVNAAVHVHLDPAGDDYRAVSRHGREERLTPQRAASPIDVATILPR